MVAFACEHLVHGDEFGLREGEKKLSIVNLRCQIEVCGWVCVCVCVCVKQETYRCICFNNRKSKEERIDWGEKVQNTVCKGE